MNQPEDVNVQTKEEVKEEDDDDNKVAPDLICRQCGTEFKSRTALVKHQVQVHKKSLKICDVCWKTCDNQKSLTDHKRHHKKVELQRKTLGILATGVIISPRTNVIRNDTRRHIPSLPK